MIYIGPSWLDEEFARVAIQGDIKIVIPTMYHPVLWKFPRVWQNPDSLWAVAHTNRYFV